MNKRAPRRPNTASWWPVSRRRRGRGRVLSRWKERVDSGATVPGAEPRLGFRNGGEQCALIEGQVQGRSRSVGEQEQRRSLQTRVGDAVYGAGGTWADTDQHHAGLAGQSSHYRRVRLRSGAHELETDCAGLIDQIEARPTSPGSRSSVAHRDAPSEAAMDSAKVLGAATTKLRV